MIQRILQVLLTLVLAGACFAQISVRSNLVQVHEVVPGEVVEAALVIENTGATEASVRIYQTDYLFQADGAIDYGEPGTTRRSNAGWIQLEQIRVDIPARARADVTYRIETPSENLTGTFWSVVMIEESALGSAGIEGAAVNTVLRYGVQVVTEFGNGEALLEFLSPSLEEAEEDGYVLQVDVVNSGEQMLQADHYVELYDENGNRVAVVEGERRRTYPGTGIRQHFPLGVLPPGPYSVLVIADTGSDELFGAQYQLQVSEPD